MTQLETYLQNLQRFGIVPGLERIRALLHSAGDPQLQYPVMLVGGTNGKGSTSEFAARLLAQKRRRIGLYTSPHLYNWNERIRILPGTGLFEGAISDAALDTLFNDAMPHIEAVADSLGQPTEFEVMTFLGLWHFARQKVDAAVVEVGLGGKWDATNVTEPTVSVVTHVALDHMDRLGNTLEAIAADKVEIARPGRPFITGEWKQNVLDVFENHRGATGDGVTLRYRQGAEDFNSVNVGLALCAAMRFCNELGWKRGIWPFDPWSLRVVGRAEIIAHQPDVLIDGANNPDGALLLAEHLRRNLHLKPQNLVLVLGILADKDWQQMTQILAPLAKIVIATQSQSPRAAPASQVAEVAQQYCARIETVMPVAAALERAKSLAQTGDTIVVTGSFTTIAEVPRDVSGCFSFRSHA